MSEIVKQIGPGVLERALRNAELKRAASRLGSARTVKLGGVWGSSSALVAAALARMTSRPVLFIAPHLDDADEVADDIEVLTGSPAHLLPAWEVDIGTDHANDEVAGERARVCNLLLRMKAGLDRGDAQNPDPLAADGMSAPNRGVLVSPKADVPSAANRKKQSSKRASAETLSPAERVEVIVAPVMALLQPMPTRETLLAGRLTLKTGQTLLIHALLDWLVGAGFEHVEQVDQQGEFVRNCHRCA